MNKKHKFDLHYFLNDASFENWAKGLNNNDVSYWNSWIQKNPEHLETVHNAKSIITGINFNQDYPSNIDVDHALSKVLDKIDIDDSSTKKNEESSLIEYGIILYSCRSTSDPYKLQQHYIF